jgi:hypothetical protein
VGTLRLKLALVVAVVGAVALGAVAIAHDRGAFRAKLTGFEEVPAIVTDANGRFEASLNRATNEIAWTLHYQDPSSTVQQAHIHVGQPAVNGGIVVFLCTNLGNGPAGTQACPPAPATISGTIKPADVLALPAQGVAAGAFDSLVRAMRAGVTYANVHTVDHGGGEVRGQISSDDDGRH